MRDQRMVWMAMSVHIWQKISQRKKNKGIIQWLTALFLELRFHLGHCSWQICRLQGQDTQTPHAGNRLTEALMTFAEQNMISESLVNQHEQARLSVKDVPVSEGNPLTYRSFIRAFQQVTEQRTDNDPDNLYNLQQYTAGKPKHMSQKRGFKEKNCFKSIMEMS